MTETWANERNLSTTIHFRDIASGEDRGKAFDADEIVTSSALLALLCFRRRLLCLSHLPEWPVYEEGEAGNHSMALRRRAVAELFEDANVELTLKFWEDLAELTAQSKGPVLRPLHTMKLQDARQVRAAVGCHFPLSVVNDSYIKHRFWKSLTDAALQRQDVAHLYICAALLRMHLIGSKCRDVPGSIFIRVDGCATVDLVAPHAQTRVVVTARREAACGGIEGE